jgi:hypothetical protein
VACAIKQFQTASLAKKPEGAVDGGDESPTDGQAEKVQRFVTKNEDLKRYVHSLHHPQYWLSEGVAYNKCRTCLRCECPQVGLLWLLQAAFPQAGGAALKTARSVGC